LLHQKNSNVLETRIVGVQLVSSVVKALRVAASDKGDVYVNYSMVGLPEAHASYHASGQQHIKKGGKYVEWNGGPTGLYEPMKIFRAEPESVVTRQDCGSTIGWEVSKLSSVLPVLSEPADMLVDARPLRGDSILAFEVHVVGDRARPRGSVVGFPVIASHRFSNAVQVEINAFGISDTVNGAVWLETF